MSAFLRVASRALLVALLAGGSVATSTAQAQPAIGTILEDLSCLDIRAQRRRLSDFGTPRALVLFFVTKDCPMVGRVLPKVDGLAQAFAGRGVQFVAVNVGRSDTMRDIGTQALEFHQSYPFVKDDDLRLVRALGVEHTTAAVVLDGDRRLCYRGRVDDQVRYANVKAAPSREDLRLAVESVLAGTPVEVAETPVEGCRITHPVEPSGSAGYTFHRDVEPLVQRHCQECHHAGGSAPFALVTYDEVADHAATLAEVVRLQIMPPWHASDAHGTFRNRRGLSADERALLADWLRSGLARGAPADAPPAREFAPGPWRIGTPDLILTAASPMYVPEEGIVPYIYQVFPHLFEADTWIEALEILPENKRVLHHANLAFVERGKGFSQDGFITGFVPGGDPFVLDPGTAFKIPKGSVFAIQAHYVTTGKAETDRIRIGIRFPKAQVARRAEVLVVTNTRFAIAAGASSHPVTASRRLPADVSVIGLFSHMHLRGRDMTFVAHRPEGPPQTLLMIPNYDFEWQASYRYHAGAMKLPARTRVEVIAHFDNSAFNPFNPDPDSVVRFGQQTFEEMMYGFVFFTRDGDDLALRVDPTTGREG